MIILITEVCVMHIMRWSTAVTRLLKLSQLVRICQLLQSPSLHYPPFLSTSALSTTCDMAGHAPSLSTPTMSTPVFLVLPHCPLPLFQSIPSDQ